MRDNSKNFGWKTSGMKSILVKTGKFIEENLVSSSIKPDYIINSINDLNKIIKLK